MWRIVGQRRMQLVLREVKIERWTNESVEEEEAEIS